MRGRPACHELEPPPPLLGQLRLHLILYRQRAASTTSCKHPPSSCPHLSHLSSPAHRPDRRACCLTCVRACVRAWVARDPAACECDPAAAVGKRRFHRSPSTHHSCLLRVCTGYSSILSHAGAALLPARRLIPSRLRRRHPPPLPLISPSSVHLGLDIPSSSHHQTLCCSHRVYRKTLPLLSRGTTLSDLSDPARGTVLVKQASNQAAKASSRRNPTQASPAQPDSTRPGPTLVGGPCDSRLLRFSIPSSDVAAPAV